MIVDDENAQKILSFFQEMIYKNAFFLEMNQFTDKTRTTLPFQSKWLIAVQAEDVTRKHKEFIDRGGLSLHGGNANYFYLAYGRERSIHLWTPYDDQGKVTGNEISIDPNSSVDILIQVANAYRLNLIHLIGSTHLGDNHDG